LFPGEQYCQVSRIGPGVREGPTIKKKVVMVGGGSEGEEYLACSAKVMTPEGKWWRRFEGENVFTSVQEAIDNVA
jgi:hypothetical protein